MCHLSLTPRTYWEVISDRQRTGPRESHPSEDLSELPPLRDPATRWFPNVMDYSDLKQGCGWTGVPLCPFPVMAAPGAARFLQAAVTRSYRTGLYARPIMIIRWDLLIMSVYGQIRRNPSSWPLGSPWTRSKPLRQMSAGPHTLPVPLPGHQWF